jgi:predicted transcriptional regulator
MLAMAGCHRYIASMDTAPRPDDRADALDSETEAERRDRLAWEAERIAEADADIAAGRLVDSARVKAWIDSIGTDHELPVPYSGR